LGNERRKAGSTPNLPVSGKRMYANEREAKATAAHRMAEKETGPAQLRTYRCLYCGTWHLTSKEA
jgi:hypothetical protein